MDNDRPPILGVVGRTTGHIRLTVSDNTQQATIQPQVEADTQATTRLNTDESSAYRHIAETGRRHVTVCHSRHEYARDDDGDGFCEVHCNTMEGIWTGLRNFLRPFRGVHKKYLAAYVAMFEWASHELRTPLAAIKGNITSLLADDVQWDAAAQREFLEIASAETDRLSALVTDLLDLSKIQAGTLVVNREPCALAPLAERAAARARPSPDGRLTLHLPPDLPAFLADPPRIEAVLRSLIENVVKYSPPDSPIRITAQRDDGHLLVRVADDGPGIPPPHREKIFDRFYRIDNGLARQTGGAGLGLAICKGFIEAHGGKIWIGPSERGTVFVFTLPL